MSQPVSAQKHNEDIVFIWLDESIVDFHQKLLFPRKINLFSYFKSIHPFIDSNSCHEYIQKTNDLEIVLIVSGSLGETFVPLIHDLTQIRFVYVLCFDIEKHENWIKQWNKIRGLFNDDKLLAIKLYDDLNALAQKNLSFTLFETGQRSLRDLTNEQASFMWSQLIIEVLLRLPQTPDAKVEMIAECKSTYKDNPIILASIDEFEKTYRSDKAINWYTKNTFLFELFNRAFRRQDFEVIFKYRSFLLDLYKAIHELHINQYYQKTGLLTVHRGQPMFKHELMKLKQNIGQLISTSTFFSTSATQIVAVSFCGNGEFEAQGIVSVMFQIEVDLSVSGRPFALIESLSSIQDERETLFSMGHVFRVEYVDLELDTIWLVKLVWDQAASQKLKEMRQLTEVVDFYTNLHIGERPSILAFGYLLSETGLLAQASRFYLYLLKILPDDHPDLGILHNNFGEVLRKLNYFQRARYQYEKAIEFCTDTISIYHPLWAIIHSNIGLLNISCGNHKEALKYYRCAAFLLSRYDTTCIEMNMQIYIDQAFVSVYYGLGIVWASQGHDEIAKQCHEKALQMELSIVPKDHPTLIESYHALGCLARKLEKYEEALKHYETSLRIARINLLPQDQRYLLLHVDIATLILHLYQDAAKTLEHCSYAQEILKQMVINQSNSSFLVVYKRLAVLYFHLNLLPMAIEMWDRYMEAEKRVVITQNNNSDLFDVLQQVHDVIPQTTSKFDLNYFLFYHDQYPSSRPSMIQRVTKNLCEFADQSRTSGYIRFAIQCYLHLLKEQPASGDPCFDQRHKSRLHNNLATCYQDLDDTGNALHHYQLSMDIVKNENSISHMQRAQVHYNMALICNERNEFHQARKYLHQSLNHFSKLSNFTSDVLDIKIYIALIKIYQKWNDWNMVRIYYERIVDQMKQDEATPSIIEKYERYLQDAIEKYEKYRSKFEE